MAIVSASDLRTLVFIEWVGMIGWVVNQVSYIEGGCKELSSDFFAQ